MTILNESDIEQNLIDLLITQGYEYYYGSDIAPYSSNPQSESFGSVVLEKHLKESLFRLNPNLPELAINDAYLQIINLSSNDLMANNEKFHTNLTDGIDVEYFKDGNTKGIKVRLIDLENIIINTFLLIPIY